MNDNWKPICNIQDIPVLGARCVQRKQGLDVAIFRNEQNEVFALLDRCPHKGGPLSQGLVTGQTVVCPLHNWTIGLCNGQAHAPDEGCTPRFSVQVQLDMVYLNHQELDTLALDATRPIAGPARRTSPAAD